MATPVSGKAFGILSCLAHFLGPEEAGDLLQGFAAVLGERLEHAEQDLYEVLRSHHVETAENAGSRGYTAPPEKRGDLDKILALYLEALGGTALLVEVIPRFTVRSFDARRLAASLCGDKIPLMVYLKARAAEQLYERCSAGDPDAVAAVNLLIVTEEDRQALSESAEAAAAILRKRLDDLLRRYDVANTRFAPGEIGPWFALALLLGRPPIAVYLRDRLPLAARSLLYAYDGGPRLDPALQKALAAGLNDRVLADPRLFRALWGDSAGYAALALPDTALRLIYSIYRDLLRQRYEQEPDQVRRSGLLAVLEAAEPPRVPVGDDQARLNRLLLEAIFSRDEAKASGFRPRQIPPLADVRTVLLGVLNGLLTTKSLFSEKYFEDLAEDFPLLEARYGADSDWLNRVLVETALPREVEKSHVPYRERLRGLIAVLRTGACTRQGILDIVAANLGIIGDDPAARAARAQITIEEFDPQRAYFFGENDPGVAFYGEFDVVNPNPEPRAPDIQVTVRDVPIRGLANVRFVDITTKKTIIQVATRLKPGNPGDILVFSGNTAALNTLPVSDQVQGKIPPVEPQPKTTRWRFEADLIDEDGRPVPVGRFALAIGDKYSFDRAGWAIDVPVVDVRVLSYKFTPGVFTVKIPWHIPGFTDKFAETADHPRHQILDLVNRVRAAGVLAHVTYRQPFAEDHDHHAGLRLEVQGALLAETQDAQDSLWAASLQRAGENHEMTDRLSFEGRFDRTSFDSLNTFAR